VVEFASALGVRVRTSAIGPAEANRVLTHLDAWLARRAELLDVEPADHHLAASFVRRFELGLWAPDALHIAVCQRLAVPLLTYDMRQAVTAQRLGIACDPAGAAPSRPGSV
jgi:uncharacterized protein